MVESLTGFFQSLDYELIWKLQIDELVDVCRTPQTKASIKIVLGTLWGFGSVKSEEALSDKTSEVATRLADGA